MKNLLLLVTVFSAGLLVGQKTYSAPSTVLHVITVRWTKDSTPSQRQAALDGIKAMAQNYPGIKNLWAKSFKVQPNDYHAAFALEFTNQQALEDYVRAPAHQEWKKLYDPVHDESQTQDISN